MGLGHAWRFRTVSVVLIVASPSLGPLTVAGQTRIESVAGAGGTSPIDKARAQFQQGLALETGGRLGGRAVALSAGRGGEADAAGPVPHGPVRGAPRPARGRAGRLRARCPRGRGGQGRRGERASRLPARRASRPHPEADDHAWTGRGLRVGLARRRLARSRPPSASSSRSTPGRTASRRARPDSSRSDDRGDRRKGSEEGRGQAGANPGGDGGGTAGGSRASASPARPPARRAPASSSALPYIIGGVGVASLGAAGVFFLLRQGAINKLDDKCSTNKSAPSSSRPPTIKARPTSWSLT